MTFFETCCTLEYALDSDLDNDHENTLDSDLGNVLDSDLVHDHNFDLIQVN